MRSITFLLFFSTVSVLVAQSPLTSLVNPFVGTDGHGHTFPGATLPFGMVQLSPDTRTEGWDACSGYHYSDSTILGFSHTHLSGTGVPDYCDILITPGKDNLPNGGSLVQHFSHTNEQASPGYYAVKLQESGIQAELTATVRSGMHRYTFPKGTRVGYIVVDLLHRDKLIEGNLQSLSPTTVVGSRHSQSWAAYQELYFTVQFSKSVKQVVPLAQNGKMVTKAAYIFDLNDEPLLVKVALSSVSTEGAVGNLDAENKGWDFDAVRMSASRVWETELGSIRVAGGNIEQQRTFYTALYHCMMAPNIMNDVSGFYRGMDREVHRAAHDQYTVFSLWDTYRALHPLLSWIQPIRARNMVLSLLEDYKQQGQLPVWELWANETDCMIGNHAVPVLLDAMQQGLCTEAENKELYQAMLASVSIPERGMEYYEAKGFINAEEEGESISKTLEFAYDDWCVAQAAKKYGTLEEYGKFSERSQSWRNHFDPTTKMLRPRKHGGWLTPFDPTEVNNCYTEANAWQYNFYVPHDLDTYISFVGGAEAFEQKLDALFETKSSMTGRVQSDITGLIGQYAQGNEPSHHVAWLYYYVGKPWKTHKLVHQILDSLYSDRPNGLCGNDDCGQMSAWYVLNAVGLYPVNSGSGEYLTGVPLFDRVDFMEGGVKPLLIIEKRNDLPSTIMSLYNGVGHAPYLTVNEMKSGGRLVVPTTFSNLNPLTPLQRPDSRVVGVQLSEVPTIQLSQQVGYDSSMVKISCLDTTTRVRYRIMNPDSTISKDWADYKTPFWLKRTGIIQAAWYDKKGAKRGPTWATYQKLDARVKIKLFKPFNPMYPGLGRELSLIDGLKASSDFHDQNWQGYHDNDMEVVVDIGEARAITEIGGRFLQNLNTWIWFPRSLIVAVSDDGVTFGPEEMVPFTEQEHDTAIQIKELVAKGNWHGRYVRIKAINYGDIPSWHVGFGERGHLFVDELIIR